MAPLLGLVQMVLAAYLIMTLVVGAMDAFHLLRCVPAKARITFMWATP
jgi:hypothetical protein